MNQGDVDNTVRLLDAEGRDLWATKIDERGGAGLVGETSSGEIVASCWSLDSVPTTLYLDGATGVVVRKLKGLAPAGGLPFFGEGGRSHAHAFTASGRVVHRVRAHGSARAGPCPGRQHARGGDLRGLGRKAGSPA